MSAADLTADGEFPKSAVEDLIEGLEAAIPMAGPSLLDQNLGTGDFPAGGTTEMMPVDIVVGEAGVADLSNDQVDEIFEAAGLNV